MTKRQERFYKQCRLLQSHGWNVDNKYRQNSGSETTPHWVAKCLVAKAATDHGHRVRMECEHDERGEIDVLIIPERGKPIAVECETSPTEDVLEDKRNRYISGTPIRDMIVVNVNDMPLNMIDAYAWIEGQLP